MAATMKLLLILAVALACFVGPSLSEPVAEPDPEPKAFPYALPEASADASCDDSCGCAICNDSLLVKVLKLVGNLLISIIGALLGFCPDDCDSNCGGCGNCPSCGYGRGYYGRG